MVFYCASEHTKGYGLKKDLNWCVREFSKEDEKILRESKSWMTNTIYMFSITKEVAEAMNMKENVLYSYHFHRELSKDESVIYELYQEEKKGIISQEGELYLAYARAGYLKTTNEERFYEHLKSLKKGTSGKNAWVGFYQGWWNLNYKFDSSYSRKGRTYYK